MIFQPIIGGGTNGSVKIATGSYVGNGTYGESNPTLIEFPFVPVFAMIFTMTPGSTNVGPYWLSPVIGELKRVTDGKLTIDKAKLTMDGNTAKISGEYAPSQANSDGATYTWIAYTWDY